MRRRQDFLTFKGINDSDTSEVKLYQSVLPYCEHREGLRRKVPVSVLSRSQVLVEVIVIFNDFLLLLFIIFVRGSSQG